MIYFWGRNIPVIHDRIAGIVKDIARDAVIITPTAAIDVNKNTLSPRLKDGVIPASQKNEISAMHPIPVDNARIVFVISSSFIFFRSASFGLIKFFVSGVLWFTSAILLKEFL